MDTNKKPKQPCPTCGGSDFIYKLTAADYIAGDRFDLYKCLNCKVVSTFPLLTNEEIEKYYRKIYYGTRKLFIDSMVNLFRRLGNGLNTGAGKKVLDIGCGTGSFLAGLKRRGWEIYGTEFASEDYIVPEVYPSVRRQTIDKCGFSNKMFDVVTMWHILEHVDDPVLYVSEANRLLKSGGVLLVEVPNIESWQARITGPNWFNVEVPRHRFHFSPQTLSDLLIKHGFSDIKISYANFIYNIYGSVQSFLNMAGTRSNFMFDFLNGKVPKSELSKNKLALILIIIGIIPLSLASAILCCGEIIFRKGGIMLIKASKK